MRRRPLSAVAAVAFALASPAAPCLAGPEATERDAESLGPDLRVDLEATRFSGDYGSDQETTFDALTTRLRWQWRRTQVRISLPLLRLQGDARLVAGTPTPNRPGSGQGPPGPPPSQEPVEATESGLGDVLVRVDRDLMQGAVGRPWLTALAQVKLPTADESAGLGTGETDVEGGLVYFHPVGRYGIFVEGRYAVLGDPPGIELDDVVRASVGLSRRLSGPRRVLVYVFGESRSHPIPGREDRRDLLLGARTQLGADNRVRLSAGAYLGLSETAEDWGLQLAIGREF